MKRKRFTEEQIIGILREHEAGAKTADLARKHGLSEATLYNWKARFGGMDVSDAKKLRALEEETGKLNRNYEGRHCELSKITGRQRPLKICVTPKKSPQPFESDEGTPDD